MSVTQFNETIVEEACVSGFFNPAAAKMSSTDSAVQILGDETLATIARELVEMVRRNVTIDWTVREAVRAKLRIMVKRILRKYGYPPDKQESATQTVLEQAELLCKDWTM